MRKPFLIALSVVILLSIWCCGGDAARQEYVDRLEHERDSVSAMLDSRDKQIDQLTGFFDSLSTYIDSISMQEDLIFNIVDIEGRQRMSRPEMRRRLESLANTIARQRDRIRLLTDSLNAVGDPEKYASLSSTVMYLTEQLAEKEKKVNQLMAELNKRDRSLRELTQSYNEVQEQLTEATAQNEVLSNAVVEQSTALNETYILIGTQKELKDWGVLSKGGFLKKSKFNAGAIDLSLCQRVDIRNVTELPLKSKKPKIHTAVPDGSYHWVSRANDMVTLVIDDATTFWSLSNVLVIQL